MFPVVEPRWRNEVNAVTQQEVKNPLECSKNIASEYDSQTSGTFEAFRYI